MIEISAGVVATVMIAVVGNLYMTVDATKIMSLTNKDHISTNQTTFEAALAAQKAAGEAEIKRSTAIDVQQASDIDGNFVELNKHEDEININKTEIAVLYERTGQHAKEEDTHHEEERNAR